MDGSIVDHSDSDSGESWTLLEHSPAYGEDAPEFTENITLEQVVAETNVEKDDDTDGISVISDSEPESSTPCEIKYGKCLADESRPTELLNPQFISANPLSPNNNNHHESIRSEDDFLGDNTGKHKTYVHRRNKRLSTVLNIIMLGSVITAAGVAIGHMWGAKNECSIHTTPSINKILSNLYKLQEENAYLRNKLKELTLASSLQMQQRKMNMEKIPYKQQRCKKVYEEPLNSKNMNSIKCIDNENAEKLVNSHVIQPDYEKEFISDIEKLKNIYQQNKSWLDEEVAKRMKNEEQTIKKMVNNIKTPLTSIIEEQKITQDENMKEQVDVELNKLKPDSDAEKLIEFELNSINNDVINETPPIKKVTYADSLKSAHKIQKRDVNVDSSTEKQVKDHLIKRKIKNVYDTSYDVLSEEELKKDDRYVGPKMKQDKKKRDRQKLHKKQKRRNKYEQWEMKGGYLKDYDEFSITSSQENEYILKKPDRNILSRDFEKRNYINQFSENNDGQNNNSKNDNEKTKDKKQGAEKAGKGNKNEDLNWYDKRAVLRTEARKRLEHELFGETSPNNAGWYFRRMQRREQCRAKGDNSTYKKLSKRNMNFKMKH